MSEVTDTGRCYAPCAEGRSCCLQGALQAFIDYIVRCKTVMLEDLASEFNLRVQVSLIGSLIVTLP